MARVLGWTDAQRDGEVDHYLKRVEAERESQTMPDDETADAARMGAEDVVPIATTSSKAKTGLMAQETVSRLRRTFTGVPDAR